MIPEIRERRDQIVALGRRYGVRRLDVFGSAATGSFDPARSDIDFLVEYPEGYEFGLWMIRYFDLKGELEALLGRPVDLVKTNAPNSPEFWASVNDTRESVYDATQDAALVI